MTLNVYVVQKRKYNKKWIKYLKMLKVKINEREDIQINKLEKFETYNK